MHLTCRDVIHVSVSAGQGRAEGCQQMEGISDVSSLFWQFVKDVIDMPYADLYRTDGFMVLSDARGSLALSRRTLGVKLCEMQDKLPEGVTYEALNQRYVFPDVTSLMRSTPQMVINPRSKRKLEECLRRIVCFVEIVDLATDLEHQDLGDELR